MALDSIRAFCLKLPGATEQLRWGDNLVFKVGGKVGGKMFAIASLGEDDANKLAFKCAPEEFAVLTECEGIIPAPYFARANWVSLRDFDVLPAAEVRRRLRDSYDLVLAKLPRKVRQELF